MTERNEQIHEAAAWLQQAASAAENANDFFWEDHVRIRIERAIEAIEDALWIVEEQETDDDE